MKILLIAILIQLSFLSYSQRRDGALAYSANIDASYHWSEFRKGISFNSNFNIIPNSKRFPLFLGFNIGFSSKKYEYSLTNSQINNYAIEDMEGDVLTKAYVPSDEKSTGITAGFNLKQYFFLDNSTFPFFGIGLRYTRFPKETVSITHNSVDSYYEYYGSTTVDLNDAFWRIGIEGSIWLGASGFQFTYGIYPKKDNTFQYIGFGYVIANGYRRYLR